MDNFPKIGILGGGQLGKMLCEAALPWHLDLHILDKSVDFPAGPYTSHFEIGDFSKKEDVLRFGEKMDVISIEIESVNTEALRVLEKSGVKIYPQPHIIELIQDKGAQKEFYVANDIPTSPFQNLSYAQLLNEIQSGKITFPFVQKARTGGYDGRGVSVVKSEADLLKDVDSMIEPLVSIEKEISVIVARNASGNIISYDAVEMVFNPKGNLVDYLISPADISDDLKEKADNLARSIIEKLGMIGLLAVELFITTDGHLLVNEVAPRPHNSGHHTIKNTSCSQYEQLLRVLVDLPLVSGKMIMPSMMVNILGPDTTSGKPIYVGLDRILAVDGIHMFLYGKNESRPLRKMGHFTITGSSREDLFMKADLIKEYFKIEIE